jgi:hypothetical protein
LLTLHGLQVCRTNPGEKGKYIKIILALLQSTHTSVVYECAVTLTSLSQAPTAVRAVANCYCQLLMSQSDNNVKLIILDRLQELKDKHMEVIQASHTPCSSDAAPHPQHHSCNNDARTNCSDACVASLCAVVVCQMHLPFCAPLHQCFLEQQALCAGCVDRQIALSCQALMWVGTVVGVLVWVGVCRLWGDQAVKGLCG